MAISIDWSEKVIYVPKADLELVQSTPSEIRQLDLDWFRLQLKDIEDSEEGIVNPDTHVHYPPVTVGGVTLARVVQIINGYTVTFEDGQYAVNLVGANSNLADRVNVNQVSVRASNSAGLISSTLIEHSAFNGGVTVDILHGVSGTVGSSVNPIGTSKNPVNNMADALLIAQYRGFTQFYIVGDITLDNSQDFSSFIFIGSSADKTTITVADDANVSECEFYECTLTGILDGNCKVKNAVVENINYISGYVELCVLKGIITLGGGAEAIFLDCWAGTKLGQPPVLDLGGSGQTLVLQNFNGYIKLINKTGPEQANISLNSGWIEIDSTVTEGSSLIIGVGQVIDNSGPNFSLNTTYLLSSESIASAVWNGNEGIDVRDELTEIFKLTGNPVTRSGNIITIYEKDGITPWRKYDLTNGGRRPL